VQFDITIQVKSIGNNMNTFIKTLIGTIALVFCLAATAKDSFGSPDLKVPDGAEQLNIVFSDTDSWDGKRVPKTMQCQALGGKGSASPKLFVLGAPDKTKSLIVFFENPIAHDNHGLVRVREERNHESRWTVPPIRNKSPPDMLPKGVELFDGGSTWGNAYNSPCPTAGSWLYSVSIYALDENGGVVGFGRREIGYAP
jgi:phosphatidylethanolamine-binding protein (PEBP) family uncharacterized protein